MTVRDQVHFGTWKNVQLADWFAATSEAGVEQLATKIDELCACFEGRVGILHVVGIESSAPSAKARKRLGEVFSARAQRIGVNVTLIEAEGFRAATVRAVASGIAMTARLRFPHLVHGDPGEACRDVCKHLKLPDGSSSALEAALERHRAQSRKV